MRLRSPMPFMLLTAGLTALSMAVWPESIAAQSGVTGRVVDSGGVPLSGVSVSMMPESGGAAAVTRTGADGTYRFDNVKDGTYRIDFDLARFDVARRNNVRVRNGATVFGDVGLQTSWSCHCNVVITGLPAVAERSGQVLDTAGRPLPRARLEMVIPIPANSDIRPSPGATNFHAVAHADAEGRFSVLAPVESNAALTASDTGFAPVTRMISGSGVGLIVFGLPYLGPGGWRENYERFPRGCRCPTNLFTHPAGLAGLD